VIVAFDSASVDQSVALADSDGTVLGQDAWSAPRGQGSELLPRLLGLLGRQGMTLRAVTGVGIGIGPGSFTGLRVGVSLAKGLAAGLAIPVVGVPSLEAWLDAEPGAAAALVRAGAAEVWAVTRGDPDPRLHPIGTLAAEARDAAVVAPRDLARELNLTRPVPPDRAAAAITIRAAERLRAHAHDDLAQLEPIYLRPPRGLSDAQPAPITWL
jgi:tRNA threonylcarbamoyladenosine biosynthesis protein TsaB